MRSHHSILPATTLLALSLAACTSDQDVVAPADRVQPEVEAALLSGSSGGDVRVVKLRDGCDPDGEIPEFLLPIFAQLPPNIQPGCLPHANSNSVDLEEFFGALLEGGHPQWRFDAPNHVDLDETLVLVNEGGIAFGHSFTRVGAFGGTCLPAPIGDFFNQAIGGGTPVPECATLPLEILPPAGTREVSAASLGVGTHKFQCLVHPWMRAELEVRPD